MTDRAQFEAMLEALINEDHEQAKEIFHQIVVGKSRDIYEELLAEDFDVEESSEEEEESMGEASEEEEGEEEEESEDDGEEADDADSEEDPFASDDEEGDDEEDPFGAEEGEGDIEDRVMDLEDALEDLKAEFEQLLAGEEGEEHGDMAGDFGGDELAHDELGSDMGAGEEEMMFEYKDLVKVPAPKHGDDGQNTRSIVAKPNRMGGTSANIAKSFSTEKGGTTGGLAAPTTKPQDGGNVNVPGAKNATKLKPVSAGHGAEKAGKKETADNKHSLLKQAKR